jgi:hypothetical protein
MKKDSLPTKDAVVSIFANKKHDFLYNIKKLNDDENSWLPRVSTAAVAKLIKTPGLYRIAYRIYTNEAGYEAIYISNAEKIVTK